MHFDNLIKLYNCDELRRTAFERACVPIISFSFAHSSAGMAAFVRTKMWNVKHEQLLSNQMPLPLQNVHISNGGLVFEREWVIIITSSKFSGYSLTICICAANIVFNTISTNKIMKGPKKPNATSQKTKGASNGNYSWSKKIAFVNFPTDCQAKTKKNWRVNIHRSQV